MRALTARRAEAALRSDVEVFGKLGYVPLESSGPLEAQLTGPGRDLVLRLGREGRFFGGNWGLEVSTAEAVLPPTERGLTARGQGVVTMRGVRFRARGRGDERALQMAEALSADERLGAALGGVDFERLFVRADGSPVIRHLGGSVVWVLFPPIVRATPLPLEQARAVVVALEALADAGRRFVGARPDVDPSRR